MNFKTYTGGGGLFDDLPHELKIILTWMRNNLRLVFLGMGGALVAGIVYSSVYTVQPSEEAVVTRWGRYERTTLPGLHFKAPFGIETANKVKTKLVLQEEFGFRTRDTTSDVTDYQKDSFGKESLMLTGDLNVADVEWIVQYQIADPKKFLFRAQDPKRNIRDVSEAI